MTPEETRSLLEDAARAFGIEWQHYHFQKGLCIANTPGGMCITQYWNPITDIADRARMADALQIGCNWGEHYVLCVGLIPKDAKPLSFESLIPSARVYYTETNGDRGLAHSLAATRCAAAVWRSRK